MTYNEWRDELRSNLLSVTEAERRRVLDYYAEAYADRRDAGYSEYEITEYFGAPYDAAQRILCDSADASYEDYPSPASAQRETRRERKLREDERRREEERIREDERRRIESERRTEQSAAGTDTKRGGALLFVILCVIFFVPIVVLFAILIVATVIIFAAPVGIVGCGIAYIVHGIVLICINSLAAGLFEAGAGIVLIGIGIILMPLFDKLIRLMWAVLVKLFRRIKSLFVREAAV